MEQEQPFLITDLVPPERHNALEELADELRVMVGCSTLPGCIPVKTWTTGKPLSVQMQGAVRDSYSDSIVETSFEGMLNYNPQKSHDEDDDEEEQEEKNEEDDREDDKEKKESSDDELVDDISYGEEDEDSNDGNVWDNVNESGDDEEQGSKLKDNDTTTISVDDQNSNEKPSKPFIFYQDSVDSEKVSDDEIEPHGILPGESQQLQLQLGDSDYEVDDDNDDNYEDDNEYDESEEEEAGDDEDGENYEMEEDDEQHQEEEENNDEDSDANTELKTKIDKLNRLKLVMSPRVRDFVIEHGTASFQGTHDLDDEEARASSQSQELLDIMNEYNELIAYLDSPKGHSKQPAPTQGQHKKGGLKDDGVSMVKRTASVAAIAAAAAHAVAADQSHSVKAPYLVPASKPAVTKSKPRNGNSKDKNKKKKAKKQKKVVLFRPKADPPAPAVQEEVKDVSVVKNDLEMKRLAKKRLTEIEEKNKAKLAEIVERRRQEEEDLLQQELKANARRKKFKEALLEKAMKSRRVFVDGNTDIDNASSYVVGQVVAEKSPGSAPAAAPNFLAPTKAFKVQSVVRTAKQVTVSEEEMLLQQEEKREKIAILRRKFKDQHRKILSTLLAKKKDEEKKVEDDLLLEQLKKEKYKMKLHKILENSVASKATPEPEAQAVLPVSNNAATHHLNTHIGSLSAPSTAGANAAAGSALAAVRHQSLSREKPTSESSAAASSAQLTSQSAGKIGRSHQKSSNQAHHADDDEGSQIVQLEQVKQKLKLQQDKVSAHLTALSEAKKAEEAEKKQQEERSRRRKQLLRTRLQQESNERKLMALNDRPVAPRGEVVVEKKVKSYPAVASKYAGNSNQSATAANNSNATAPTNSNTSSNSNNNNGASASKNKITPEAAEAAVQRLTAVKPAAGAVSEIAGSGHVVARDFMDWKRKNSVPSDGKVFAMTGWYPCVKQALLDRGWHFNPDPTSLYFNLKWTLRSIDVCQESLQPWQYTNHYLKNVAITTKAGLIKSLQSLSWLADVDGADIIPRGYDLSVPHETQAFIDDFRCQKAESILKKLYLKLTGIDRITGPPQSESPACSSVGSSSELQQSTDKASIYDESDFIFPIPPTPKLLESVNLSEVQVNAAVFEAVCAVLEKQLKPYDDSYIDDYGDGSITNKLVTDLEWELINTYSLYTSVNILPAIPPESVDAFLREKEETEIYRSNNSNNTLTREKKRQLKLDADKRETASDNISKLQCFTMADLDRIHRILHGLRQHHRGQSALNGSGNAANNMWIVKPAAKSRGRGIATFMDLNKLLRYVEAGSGFSTQWIVQKYMENPLIIANRKFDMRQWVLVTDWNPLTIYFYDEFYARFSVEEYSTSVGDLENSYIHLVNNSIGKNSENFNKLISAENGENIEGFMWSFESFRKYIIGKSGEDLVKTKIQPRMKEIAKWSLMCASEMIEHRKNSWELYGFDFMVDDDYNAWLIEINSSPACDYSTKVTEVYVQKALVEILSVVFDYKDWEQQGKKDKDRGPKPSTGGWVNIYEGPLLDVPVGAFGTDMSIKGEAMKTKRPYVPPPQGSFLANKFQSTSTSQDSTVSEYVPSNSSNSNSSNNNNNNNLKMDFGVNANAVSIQARGLGDVKSRHSTGSNNYNKSSSSSSKPAPALPSPRKEKHFAPSSPRKDKYEVPMRASQRSAEKKLSLGSKHSAKDPYSPRTTAGLPVALARADSKKGKTGFDDSDDENAAAPPVDDDDNDNGGGGGGGAQDHSQRIDMDDDLDDDLDDTNLDDPSNKAGQVGKADALYSRRKVETYVVPPGAKAIPIKVFEVQF